MTKLEYFLEELGLDKGEIYKKAFTHSSYAFENSLGFKAHNQRLEFLGDAVLELIISEYLYTFTKNITEGEMTRLRAQIVCENSLASVARELEFGELLWLGKGEEKTGGREKSSILADTFEAFVGALYMDVGFERSYDIVLDILRPQINKSLIGGENDFKTQLQEYVQKNGVNSLTYKIIEEKGPDHDKRFRSAVFLNGRKIGEGEGKTKKQSEQQAARKGLLNFYGQQ
ncbi:ribonuclease III [Proteinivorax hydrogeniformans]|uniref:Ribonuclease 3 n=1 Tax=Proteinivorax hydrogeniformans TaxID=1826727 RepID=A0AAU8HPC7_9FIRM